MAKSKIEPEEVVKQEVKPVKVKRYVPLLTVDFAREDLNTIARKINEVIEHINAN